jgi:DNA-binding Lrp family transcriptional regulator
MNDHPSSPHSPGSAPAGRSVRPLDAPDRQILRELIKDARTSIRSLAERVHVSRASAYSRVGRLVDEGVITGFSAKIDHERAGLGTSAYVSLTIEQNSWPEVSAHLGRLPYVEHVSRLGADFDVLVLVRAPDNAALRIVVLDRIQAIPSVRSTRTWLVFDEFEGAGADWDVT